MPRRPNTRPARPAIAASLLAAIVATVAAAGDDAKLPPRWRRPVALAPTPDERWLFVANRTAGSISVVDLTAGRTVREEEVGGSVVDLALTPAAGHLLALEAERGHLHLFRRDGGELTALSRTAVPAYPVRMALAPDGARAFVASLWSRRVTIVEVAADAAETTAVLRVSASVAMPFAPRALLLVSDHLVVADAFGGYLATLDPAAPDIASVLELTAHNIRGLAVGAGGDELLLTHQTLNETARTHRSDIHWGVLLTNDVSVLPLAGLLEAPQRALRQRNLYPLGEAGAGAGDPAGVLVAASGKVVVALSGTAELAIGRQGEFGFRRRAVGDGPSALAVSASGATLFVANTFGDSVSVVDLDRERARACIPLGPQPADDLVARGEALFHDARLSHESWMSCHSCHPDGHTTGRRNDNLGDGSFGAPKRILSLRGAADTLPLGWNGAVATLEEQVRASLDSTLLGGRGDDDDSTVRAIAAYLRTLPPAPPPSAFARPEAARDAAVARGRALFGELGCRRCHVPPRYTSPGVYDVGLEDEAGNRRFHPPSLRGVAQRDAYFHDNRARSLAQVFSVGSHHVGDELPAADLAALVAFLESL